jgi:dihydrofolate synthase/folylpolyglutamate synthase
MSDVWDDLFALRPSRIELTLDRVRSAAIELGLLPPSRRVRIALVAGTNGKGSTTTMLAAMLQAHGQRVGLYQSPHLVHPRERMRVQGAPIADEDAERHVGEVLRWNERYGAGLTYFEAGTLAALRWFEAQAVDAMVLEVGLGGRLDATNIVQPDVSVITSIGLDHCDWLGDTVEQIAWEKGGILRPGIPFVSGLDRALTLEAMRGREAPLPVRRIGVDFSCELLGKRLRYQSNLGGCVNAELFLGGRYQAHNAGLALAALEHMVPEFRPDAAATGLAMARIRGRFETHIKEGVRWFVDGAHNPAGAQAFAEALAHAETRALVALVSVRRTKDALGVLVPLRERVSHWVFPSHRIEQDAYWRPEELADLLGIGRAQCDFADDPQRALELAQVRAQSLGCVCAVWGSLYALGAVLEWLGDPAV